MHTSTINPFYAARIQRATPTRPEEPPRPVYAKLPLAPINASPVPGLTSLYHSAEAGDYGDRSYPGNCGGNLTKDLLRYFKPFSVLDPMTGSGTCRDVCNELGIYGYSSDLHQGADACDDPRFPRQCFDFCWVHPPYWRMKLYAEDPRCLSRAPTLPAFLERYRLLIDNCAGSLTPSGKLAILHGNRYCEPVPDDEAQFWSLYGHIPGQGLECIGDFKTRQLAEEVLARITGGPSAAELLDALTACIWWWDTLPARIRHTEEPETFVRGRALITRAAAA